MERKFSLAIHDLKVSGAESTVNKIKIISGMFRVPLTLHLVFDEPLKEGSALCNFLLENIQAGKVEVVFHGLTHLCSEKVARWIAWYHKYQAEYLVDSDIIRSDSALMYKRLSETLGFNPGICPPCWLASRKNLLFLKSFNPPYIEAILNISAGRKKYFSSVLSLASPDDAELFFLRILARIIYISSVIFRVKRIRIAIHDCDLSKPLSMEFFGKIIPLVQKHRYKAVLQKNLIEI